MTRSRGTRSREIRLVSRERDYILAKYFYNAYIRSAPLIVKNCACDLDSNTHTILFLNDNDSAMSIKTVSHSECQWSVRSTFCRCPCRWISGSAIITLPMWTLSFTDMGSDKNWHWHSRCETGVKDIQIYIHAAADPERATQIVFSTTHHYFGYRHLNDRSTGIKVYSLGVNTYCLQ